jgi:hypothetical protein
MSSSITWVSPRHAELKKNEHGQYYAFYAHDQDFKRYRVFSDAQFKPRFIHFLAAIEAGAKIWMPIEPKKDAGLWQIAIEHVDDEPPSFNRKEDSAPAQLSFEPICRSFSTMPVTRKQTFLITEDYAQKASVMAKKLQFPTKSDFLANVIASYLDLCDKMNKIC